MSNLIRYAPYPALDFIPGGSMGEIGSTIPVVDFRSPPQVEPVSGPIGAFFQRWLITTIGVLLAALLVPGIHYDHARSLVLASLVLGLLNSFIRPVLVIFTLPFVIFTLGLGLLVINALLLYFVGSAISGFHVTGFWSAFFGALLISLTSFGAQLVLAKPSVTIRGRGRTPASKKHTRNPGPYIDV